MEIVQRCSARYVTKRYHNTSSVTSMLDHLEWEFLESWRATNQLTMIFNIIHGIVDIPACDYLVPASTRTRSQHSLKFHLIPASSDYYKFSFFLRTIRHWNSLLANETEAPSLASFKTGALMFVNINCLVRPCKYTLVISLSYVVGDFLGPGIRKEGRLVEGWRMHWPKLLIFSDCLSTILLTFLFCSLFLMSQPPRSDSHVWRQRVRCRCRRQNYEQSVYIVLYSRFTWRRNCFLWITYFKKKCHSWQRWHVNNNYELF